MAATETTSTSGGASQDLRVAQAELAPLIQAARTDADFSVKVKLAPGFRVTWVCPNGAEGGLAGIRRFGAEFDTAADKIAQGDIGFVLLHKSTLSVQAQNGLGLIVVTGEMSEHSLYAYNIASAHLECLLRSVASEIRRAADR